jgi:multisubunit Na+/H+ antiporter MnhB subunit
LIRPNSAFPSPDAHTGGAVAATPIALLVATVRWRTTFTKKPGGKLVLIKAVGLAVAVAVGAAGSAAADYPERDTTAVVVWAAGGGADTLGIERP